MSPARPSPWLLAPALGALASFAWAHRDPWLGPALGLLLLVAGRHRLSIPPLNLANQWRYAAALGAAFALVIAWYTLEQEGGEGLQPLHRFSGSEHLSAVGGYVIGFVLVWLWHLRIEPERRTVPILALSGAIATLSGDFINPGLFQEGLLVGFAGLSLAAAVLVAAPDEGRGLAPGRALARLSAAAGALLLVLPMAAILAVGLIGLEQLLLHRGLPLDLSRYQGLGAGEGMLLKRSARLSVSDALVATLGGDQPPGYLRTQVMGAYAEGHWSGLGSPGDSAPAAPVRRFVLSGAPVEPPPGEEPGAFERQVRLLVDLAGAVPLPYGTMAVRLSVPAAIAGAPGTVVTAPGRVPLEAYVTEPGRPTGTGAEDEVGIALEGPPEVLAALRPLAREIVGPTTAGNLAAAAALARHFRSAHAYSRDVHLAPGVDPVVDFVRNRRPGWCEHFASALALSLRSLGIPARVVGGFFAAERNLLDRSWVVRKRDAHAWCEVWDSARGAWVAVDATPPEATALRPTDGWAGWRRELVTWARLRVAAATAGLRGLRLAERLAAIGPTLRRLGRELALPRRILPLALAALALWLLRHRLASALGVLARRLRHRTVGAGAIPGPAEATRELAAVSAALARAGRPLAPTDSLEECLARETQAAGELAAFAEAYHRQRFDPATATVPAGHLPALAAAAVTALDSAARAAAGRARRA